MFCFAFLGIISQLAEPHVRTIRYEFINSKQTTNRLSTYILLSSLESWSKIQKRPIFETLICFWIFSFKAEALKKEEQINVKVVYEATTCIFYCTIFSYSLSMVSSLHSVRDKSWKIIYEMQFLFIS